LVKIIKNSKLAIHAGRKYKRRKNTQTNDVEIKATDEDQAKPVKQKKVKKPLYSELTKTIEALFCDDLDWSNFNTEWTLSVVKVM
jgi:hypothetical protein